MKNKLDDLYNHLFETLERLRDTKPAFLEPEIKRATAVRLTAEQIIAAAKVDAEMSKFLKTKQSGFFDRSAPLQMADGQMPKKLEAGKKE